MQPQSTTFPASMIARFWKYTDRTSSPDDCWPWIGPLYSNDYGRLAKPGHAAGGVLAHRFSWQLHFGPIPAGLLVCHHCDNRRCVRPDHLFVGTQRQNMDDMVAKGRGFSEAKVHRGMDHGRAILSDEQVLAIRSCYASGGVSYHGLAVLYGVSIPTIGGIVRRLTWKHL